MKILKRIKWFLFGKPSEIELVEAALNRYNNRLDEIEKQWAEDGGLCCPNCYSHEYSKLCKKVERVEHWLQALKQRKSKNK